MHGGLTPALLLAVTLTGRLELPPGTPAPELRAELTAARARESFPCIVEGSRWRCDVPDGAVDVRVVADGFAPVYLWSVTPPDAGVIRLEPGPSIAGRVVDVDGKPVEGAAVELLVEQYGTPLHTRVPQRGRRTTTNGRGFFQFRGLTPGSYVVTAHKEGRSPARRGDLRLRGSELALAEPLALATLATMSLRVVPPTDSGSRPWKLQMQRREAEGVLVRVAEGELSAAGTYEAEGLEHGSYRLAILNHRNEPAIRQHVEIDRELVPIDVTIERIAAQGEVKVGQRPLAAELRFETDGARVTTRSDEKGLFTAEMPRAGKWNVTIIPDATQQRLDTSVDVPASGDTRRIDILLPDTHIAGRVVDPQGRPVAGASVRVSRRGKLAGRTTTNADGTFDLLGVAAGEVHLQAIASAGESAEVAHVAGEVTERTLVIAPRVSFKGRLVDVSGAPVAGALVRYQSGRRLGEVASGPDGEFTLDANAAASTVDVAVVAPDHPVTLATLTTGRTTVIPLPRVPGRLELVLDGAPPWPVLARGSARFLLPSLFRPRVVAGPPAEMHAEGIMVDLAAGAYEVCLDECRSVVVTPAGRTRLDLRRQKELAQ